jgi:hypothetical protein
MKRSFNSNTIDHELDNIKIDSNWDDDTIIDFYKKKTREICARLEEEEKIKKKELLLSTNNNNFVNKNVKMFKIKRPNSSVKINNNFRKRSGNNSMLNNNNRILSANFPYVKKAEEPESVLNMLFPYVNENDFKIEPFKSGADIRKEYLEKRQYTPVIKVNMERRIKSNFIRKYKKYDKYLNVYAKNPSIRCSSIYSTEEQRRRQEFIKSKKLWLTTDDFKRYFGNSKNEKPKEINKNEEYIPNKYVEPYLSNVYRIIDKNKWMSKKNFVV